MSTALLFCHNRSPAEKKTKSVSKLEGHSLERNTLDNGKQTPTGGSQGVSGAGDRTRKKTFPSSSWWVL